MKLFPIVFLLAVAAAEALGEICNSQQTPTKLIARRTWPSQIATTTAKPTTDTTTASPKSRTTAKPSTILTTNPTTTKKTTAGTTPGIPSTSSTKSSSTLSSTSTTRTTSKPVPTTTTTKPSTSTSLQNASTTTSPEQTTPATTSQTQTETTTVSPPTTFSANPTTTRTTTVTETTRPTATTTSIKEQTTFTTTPAATTETTPQSTTPPTTWAEKRTTSTAPTTSTSQADTTTSTVSSTSSYPSSFVSSTTPTTPATTTKIVNALTTTGITDPATTTESQSFIDTLCPDRNVYSSSGKLQPNSGNYTTGDPTSCGIVIFAPDDQFMQISCSIISLKSNGSSLRIYGISDALAFPPVLNRKYISNSNRLLVSASIAKEDWFQCEWAPWNPPPNTTDLQFCQQGTSQLANGTIHPLDNLAEGEFRLCSFFISPLNYYFTKQRIQFSCSHFNLTDPGSYLDVAFAVDLQNPRVPIGNRTYFSMMNYLSLSSYVTKGDQFECKWEPYIPPLTNDFKSCRDVSSKTANGTLQPFADYDTKLPRWCDFTIQVSTDRSVQFSCSVVNLATSGSYLQLRDWNGAIIAHPPVTNQNYTSKNYSMVVTARFTYPDWFSCQWTSVPPPAVPPEPKQPVFQVCLVKEARSFNGSIQPFKESMTGIQNTGCSFYIYAPVGQRVQMTCSVVRMNSYIFPSYIKFTEMDGTNVASEPVENEIYTSYGNVMVMDTRVGSADWFECSWTTIVPASTTLTQLASSAVAKTMSMSTEASTTTELSLLPMFKLCLDEQATTSYGELQTFPSNVTGELIRECRFTVSVPVDRRVQFTCSTVKNFFGSVLRVNGSADMQLGNGGEYPLVVVNRVYTSVTNHIVIGSQLRKDDLFDCKWTTIPAAPQTTDFKLCRDYGSEMSEGTLEPFIDETNQWRRCSFTITAPAGNQIQLSCSTVSNYPTDVTSYLGVYSLSDLDVIPPLLNRIYTSRGNQIVLSSRFVKEWFSCNWTTIPSAKNTSNFTLCRDGSSEESNGTIRLFKGETGGSRKCQFSIFVIPLPPNELLQISCSSFHFDSSSSYLKFWPIPDVDLTLPLLNRVYTSTSNWFGVESQFSSKLDMFECKWSTIPNPSVNKTDFTFCLSGWTPSVDGTIKPLADEVGPSRNCYFFINPFDVSRKYYNIQLSCSYVNLTSPGSFLKIVDYYNGILANPPIANEVYSVEGPNVLINLYAQFSKDDWFDCQWTDVTSTKTTSQTTTTAVSMTTASSEPIPTFQPCSEYYMHTTSDRGILQKLPINVDQPANIKSCYFIIDAPLDRRIQFSCSVVNLLGNTSSFQLNETTENGIVPVVGTTYTSTFNNYFMFLQIADKDWIECEWATLPASSTAARNFKLCRDKFTTSSNGSLQSSAGNFTADELKRCDFTVFTPPLHRMEISCSALNFTGPNSSFVIEEIFDIETTALPVVNRKYYVDQGTISVYSQLGKLDWFQCQWTSIPVSVDKADFKLCVDGYSSSRVIEGTFQPSHDGIGSTRKCAFRVLINTKPFVHIYCPVVNLTSPGSYLKFFGINFGNVIPNPPKANQTYTVQEPGHVFAVESQFNEDDWFECRWTTAEESTTRTMGSLTPKPTETSLKPLATTAFPTDSTT